MSHVVILLQYTFDWIFLFRPTTARVLHSASVPTQSCSVHQQHTALSTPPLPATESAYIKTEPVSPSSSAVHSSNVSSQRFHAPRDSCREVATDRYNIGQRTATSDLHHQPMTCLLAHQSSPCPPSSPVVGFSTFEADLESQAPLKQARIESNSAAWET